MGTDNSGAQVVERPMNSPASQPVKCDGTRYWECPNMKEKEGDLSMEYEHYECHVCGKRYKLDYEEMR
jgi:hypothetical protein